MTDATVVEIKKEMGYTDGSQTCKTCQHFEDVYSRCDINIFYLPVSSVGWCKHGSFAPS
jgi:hypothetical protein